MKTGLISPFSSRSRSFQACARRPRRFARAHIAPPRAPRPHDRHHVRHEADQQRHDIPMIPHLLQCLQLPGQRLDERDRKYYRVSRRLHHRVELRPLRDIAPSLGVDKYVKPKLWMAWYKAQSPRRRWRYRFVARGQLPRVRSTTDLPRRLLSAPPSPANAAPADGGSSVTKAPPASGPRDQCIGGDWMEMKAGRIYDMTSSLASPGGETSSSWHPGKAAPSAIWPRQPDECRLRFKLARSHSPPLHLPWKAIQ